MPFQWQSFCLLQNCSLPSSNNVTSVPKSVLPEGKMQLLCHCKIPALKGNSQLLYLRLQKTQLPKLHLSVLLTCITAALPDKTRDPVKQGNSWVLVTVFLSYRFNTERLEQKEAQDLEELKDLPGVIQQCHPIQGCHWPCCPAQSCLPLYQRCRHCTVLSSLNCLWMKEKQLVCTVIFHFLLLMALPIASALLIITRMSFLLSVHRFMWLARMFLDPAALAVCSEAELFKQQHCLLDFSLKQVKRACVVCCISAKGRSGTEYEPLLACQCWSESKWETELNPPWRWHQRWVWQCSHAQSQARGYSLFSLTLPML